MNLKYTLNGNDECMRSKHTSQIFKVAK